MSLHWERWSTSSKVTEIIVLLAGMLHKLSVVSWQVELRPEDRFFVLACDGVWDVMSNQDVVQFVNAYLDSGMALPDIASQLLDACLAPDPRETRGIGMHPTANMQHVRVLGYAAMQTSTAIDSFCFYVVSNRFYVFCARCKVVLPDLAPCACPL